MFVHVLKCMISALAPKSSTSMLTYLWSSCEGPNCKKSNEAKVAPAKAHIRVTAHIKKGVKGNSVVYLRVIKSFSSEWSEKAVL